MSLEETAKRNAANAERIRKEREEANKRVLRNYNIKKKDK